MTPSLGVAPLPRITSYVRQLSGSESDDTSTMAINLRHLGDLSACDLTYWPHHVNSLWIGPGFCSPIDEVVGNLPTGLQQLDLDLTSVGFAAPADGIKEDMHSHQDLMYLLFERVVLLASLSLRVDGCAGVCAVAKNLHKARRLAVLDFRSNYMGDKGLEILCNAMLTLSELPQGCPLEHLVLSWNGITDSGVYSLCQVLQHPRCRLKALDLGYNDDISDVGLAAICQALHCNKSLERLTVFACPRITNAIVLKDLLVRSDTETAAVSSGICAVYNYTLNHVDLGATSARAMTDVMEQIEFGLSLNRAGRLQLRCDQDDFEWILRCNLQDDDMARAVAAAPVSVQWWRPTQNFDQQEDPLLHLSIAFHLLRQTSAVWSKRGVHLLSP